MRKQSLLTFIGIGALVVACGGTSQEPISSSSADLKGGASADGGRGHACKPLDGGTSPCARGDGGDDENEVDDEDGGQEDMKGDGGRGGRGDGGHEDTDEDGGEDDKEGDGGRS